MAYKLSQPRRHRGLRSFVLMLRKVLRNELGAASLECCDCEHRHVRVYLCDAISLVNDLTLPRHTAGCCNIANFCRGTLPEFLYDNTCHGTLPDFAFAAASRRIFFAMQLATAHCRIVHNTLQCYPDCRNPISR